MKVKIDVNVFEILKNAYQRDFDGRYKNINCIGCSELPFCARKTCISKIKGIPTPMNMKMLGGHGWHDIIQKPEVLNPLIKAIYDEIGITAEYEVIPEKEITYEVLPGKVIEGHIDTFTTYLLLEIKTTHLPMKQWSKEVAPFHAWQLNTYLGITNQILGYILELNLTAFGSESKRLKYVWDHYGYLIPRRFNPVLFQKSIDKAKLMFELMEKGTWDIPGPEYPWECRDKHCPKEIKKLCGKTEQEQEQLKQQLKDMQEMIE